MNVCLTARMHMGSEIDRRASVSQITDEMNDGSDRNLIFHVIHRWVSILGHTRCPQMTMKILRMKILLLRSRKHVVRMNTVCEISEV